MRYWKCKPVRRKHSVHRRVPSRSVCTLRSPGRQKDEQEKIGQNVWPPSGTAVLPVLVVLVDGGGGDEQSQLLGELALLILRVEQHEHAATQEVRSIQHRPCTTTNKLPFLSPFQQRTKSSILPSFVVVVGHQQRPPPPLSKQSTVVHTLFRPLSLFVISASNATSAPYGPGTSCAHIHACTPSPTTATTIGSCGLEHSRRCSSGGEQRESNSCSPRHRIEQLSNTASSWPSGKHKQQQQLCARQRIQVVVSSPGSTGFARSYCWARIFMSSQL